MFGLRNGCVSLVHWQGRAAGCECAAGGRAGAAATFLLGAGFWELTSFLVVSFCLLTLYMKETNSSPFFM